jgi:hypothetical protein
MMKSLVQKWRGSGFPVLFIPFLAVMLTQCLALAAPRPLSPPWPSFGAMAHEGFNQPSGFATHQTIDSAVWVEGWSGWALNRQGKSVAPWVMPMVVSNAFCLEPERGALRFWYRPDYGSEAGAGQTATLAALVTIKGETELLWWSLLVSADGRELHLVCQTESGPESCLKTAVNWQAGSWHMVTLGFTPTNSALFVDDQFAAVGDGVATIPNELAPDTSLVVGSSPAGDLPAQGQIEELTVFSGRKRIQQALGHIFGLGVDWDVGLYYSSLAKTAALGPVSDAEIAARAALSAQRKAAREALAAESAGNEMQLLMVVGGTSQCVTNSRLYITNAVAWFDPNTLWVVQFDVQGTNAPVEIFATTNLSGTNWVFLERGPTCATYQYTNQFAAGAFYRLGDGTVDPDGDGLSTAYEQLISHTSPTVFNLLDTDADGLSDAWELANGYHPAQADTNGNGIPDGYEDGDGDGLANLMEASFLGDAVVFNLNWRQDTDGAGIPDSLSAAGDAPPLVTSFEPCPLP